MIKRPLFKRNSSSIRSKMCLLAEQKLSTQLIMSISIHSMRATNTTQLHIKTSQMYVLCSPFPSQWVSLEAKLTTGCGLVRPVISAFFVSMPIQKQTNQRHIAKTMCLTSQLIGLPFRLKAMQKTALQ